MSRRKSFKNTFFLYCKHEWNNLKVEIINSKSVSILKKLITNKKNWKLKNSLFSIYDPVSVKLLTRPRLQFSHLYKHKSRRGFRDAINAICSRGIKVETTEHFLLSCHLYSLQRLELSENLEKVDSIFLNLNFKDKVSFLLYGSQSVTSKTLNHDILNIMINYIKESGHFDSPFICANQWFFYALLLCCPFWIFF